MKSKDGCSRRLCRGNDQFLRLVRCLGFAIENGHVVEVF